MSRKNKPVSPAIASAIEADTLTAVIEAPEGIEAPATLESAPVIEAPATSFKPVSPKAVGGLFAEKEKDSLGYSKGSFTSRIAALLATPEGATKETILSAALDITEDSAPSVRKARLTTLSVFFSDSKRSFGTYPVSRAFAYEEDEAGNIRISPASLEKARTAIAGGILSDLRTAKTETARKALLARFGY